MFELSQVEAGIWNGRKSSSKLYFHEIVQQKNIHELDEVNGSYGYIGYACDEGVKRNQGRIGAAAAPNAVRNVMGKLANHMDDKINFYDLGNINCLDSKMELAQLHLSQAIDHLLQKKIKPIVIGGGHDVAYGHYNGIASFLDRMAPQAQLGIINFDAHFDLRSNENLNHSGTPFYQISEECKKILKISVIFAWVFDKVPMINLCLNTLMKTR